MGILIVAVVLLIVGILGCELFYRHPITKLAPALAGFGAFAICWIVLMALVNNHEYKCTIDQHNFNPCSIYHINDRIAQHREFENDFLYGIFYSHAIADLPYVECSDGRLIQKIPRNEK